MTIAKVTLTYKAQKQGPNNTLVDINFGLNGGTALTLTGVGATKAAAEAAIKTQIDAAAAGAQAAAQDLLDAAADFQA